MQKCKNCSRVHIIVHNCRTQHSTEQFWWSYSPDKHQSSDAVYWRGGGHPGIAVKA